jgi:hypothetical protein
VAKRSSAGTSVTVFRIELFIIKVNLFSRGEFVALLACFGLAELNLKGIPLSP